MTGLMFNRFRDTLSRDADHYTGASRVILDDIHAKSPVWPKLVFGNIPEASTEFGLDLFEEALLSLPFKECYLQFTDDDGAHVAYFAYEDHMRGIVFVSVEADDFDYVFAPVRISLELRDAIHMSNGLPPWFADFDPKRMREVTIAYGRGLMGMLGFLNTKGTKLERIAPKDGINAKRLAQGKRPLPEYTVVKIDPEVIRQYAERGGSHASPRPHPRRGHIATIFRGTGKERKIIKPPCFVNAKPGMLPPPKYRVEPA